MEGKKDRLGQRGGQKEEGDERSFEHEAKQKKDIIKRSQRNRERKEKVACFSVTVTVAVTVTLVAWGAATYREEKQRKERKETEAPSLLFGCFFIGRGMWAISTFGPQRQGKVNECMHE